MSRKMKFVVLAMFALPFMVSAASSYTYDVSLIPSSIENGLELVNLVLAILAAAFAVKLAALSQGGSLEKTWNKLAFAAVVFAVLEVVGALKGFGLVHLGGAGDIVEFVFITVFLTVFYQTRKELLKKTLG